MLIKGAAWKKLPRETVQRKKRSRLRQGSGESRLVRIWRK